MLTRRSFVRSGAALTGDDDARMAEIKSRLASLGTSFTQNLLADERDWFMELTEDDLEGLIGLDFECTAIEIAAEHRTITTGRFRHPLD